MISSRISKVLSALSCVLLLPLVLAGCDNNPPPPPPQVVELGCPVQDPVELQRVFQGVYGVDGMSRPVNSHAVPVDVNGNCLSTAPVPDVYNAPVHSAYVTVLSARWGYHYVYAPGVVVVPVMPGVIYRTGIVPSGRVIVQTTPRVGATVVRPTTTTTVTSGGAGTVRPGAVKQSAPPVTTSPGSVGTVRPGAVQQAAPPAAVAPKTVMPSAPPAGTTSTFNRPTAPAPTSVMPSRPSAGTTSTFNRPSTSTFSRPSTSSPGRR